MSALLEFDQLQIALMLSACDHNMHAALQHFKFFFCAAAFISEAPPSL
jgi:hypothetical protein